MYHYYRKIYRNYFLFLKIILFRFFYNPNFPNKPYSRILFEQQMFKRMIDFSSIYYDISCFLCFSFSVSHPSIYKKNVVIYQYFLLFNFFFHLIFLCNISKFIYFLTNTFFINNSSIFIYIFFLIFECDFFFVFLQFEPIYDAPDSAAYLRHINLYECRGMNAELDLMSREQGELCMHARARGISCISVVATWVSQSQV